MGILEAAALGIAVGTDSFSVCVGIGVNGVRLRRTFKLSFLFAVMQVSLLMFGANLATVIHRFLDGLSVALPQWDAPGSGISAPLLHDYIHDGMAVLGTGILLYIGVSLIYGYLKQPHERIRYYQGRLGLLLLAFGVSIDALSAGIGMGMVDTLDLSLTAVTAGAVIWVMAFFGLVLGRRIHGVIGRSAEAVGGVLLMGLAVKLLLDAFC